MDRILTDPREIRDAAAQDYSDTYKSIHGFRPTLVAHWTADDFYDEAEALRGSREDAPAPTSGEGWALSTEYEGREYFDEQNDFGGVFFGMCDDEIPRSGEDY